MSLEELKARPEWRVLTAKQKAFVGAYIRSGMDTGTYDAPAAVLAAYGTKVEKNAQIFSYELLAHRKIAPLLNLHFGRSEREAEIQKAKAGRLKLLRKVRRNLRQAELGSVAAQGLLAQEERLLIILEPEIEDEPVNPVAALAPNDVAIFPRPEPKYRVGKIEIDPDDGKPYILLGVSEDGSEVTKARLLVKSPDGTFVDSIAKGTSPTYDHVPPGATPLVDKAGIVRGYRTSAGEYVRLAEAL